MGVKSQSGKTKVVVRHLPPAITQTVLMEQIDVAFHGRYNWVLFRPGKISLKRRSCSRVYIDFKSTEDVIGFAEFFNGHLFVNEKGAQFKAAVEYAPSQRVPRLWAKKDAREGTIFKDPDYLDFLQSIAKPADSLPSAEIQLERREAEERAGVAKDASIVTPLMDFVRQKRAAKSESRRILSNGKLGRRSTASGSPGASPFNRSSEKKASTKMYVLRGKNNVETVVSKRDDWQIADKAVPLPSVSEKEVLEDKSVVAGANEAGKMKILFLNGRGKEISTKHNTKSSDKNASAPRLSSREASGRLIKSILLNKDTRRSSGVQSEIQIANSEKGKRPPRPPQYRCLKDTNVAPDDRALRHDITRFSGEKRTRNKERPDRVVWAPLRRSDGSYASDDSLSTQSSVNGSQGSHKHFGRRGSSHSMREADCSSIDGKLSKRNGPSVYGSHEKQMWVQKSGSGS